MSAARLQPSLSAALPDGWLGPWVVLVRTLMDGRVTREALPAALAVHEALCGGQNGVTVARARVEFGVVRDGFGSSR